MRVQASATRPRPLPRSLNDRLTLLENEGPWRTRRRSLLRVFRSMIGRRLGSTPVLIAVIVTGAIGSGVLIYHPFVDPEWKGALQPSAIAALLVGTPPAPEPTGGEARARDSARPGFFEMTLRRGAGGEAAFPLRIVGAEAADDVTIVLRGLPAGATLSSGRRLGAGTWSLQFAQLDNLRVSLGPGTPETFELTIAVTSRAGAELATTMAQVRVVDAAAPLPVRAVVR